MSACPICDYAEEHGWWGPTMHGKTHCARCHRTWTSRTQAHCPVCCEQFASNGVANYHWGSGKSGKAPAYDARHLNASEVPKLALDERGVWHTAEAMPMHWIRSGERTGKAETASQTPQRSPSTGGAS